MRPRAWLLAAWVMGCAARPAGPVPEPLPAPPVTPDAPAGCHLRADGKAHRYRTVLVIDGAVRVPLTRTEHERVARAVKGLVAAALWERHGRSQASARLRRSESFFFRGWAALEVTFTRAGRAILFFDGWLDAAGHPQCALRHRNLTFENTEPVFPNVLAPARPGWEVAFAVRVEHAAQRVGFESELTACRPTPAAGRPALPDGLSVERALEATEARAAEEAGRVGRVPLPPPGHPCGPGFDGLRYLGPLPAVGVDHAVSPRL